ncbi:MAG: glycosyltransferase family 2 protein [Wenzhouxiangella sp.]
MMPELDRAVRRVGAIIVAFHPETGQLEELVARLNEQVDHIVVVDNSEPATALPVSGPSRVEHIQPPGNVGVAAAINLGVEALLKQGCTHGLLLDQDSLPAAGMTATLVNQMQSLVDEGAKVAAIGPAIRDRGGDGRAPFVRFRLPFNQRIKKATGSASCDFLITSGSLINLGHWSEIGPMRTRWFIDNIDLEWCFRARRKGFGIYGCFDTELVHSIGDSRLLLPLKWSPRYRHHDPSRLYTMMRNRVYLYRSEAPLSWIIQDTLRAGGKLVLFSLLKPRRRNLASMLRGLWEGFTTSPSPRD